jgi:hypothetical protein
MDMGSIAHSAERTDSPLRANLLYGKEKESLRPQSMQSPGDLDDGILAFRVCEIVSIPPLEASDEDLMTGGGILSDREGDGGDKQARPGVHQLDHQLSLTWAPTRVQEAQLQGIGFLGLEKRQQNTLGKKSFGIFGGKVPLEKPVVLLENLQPSVRGQRSGQVPDLELPVEVRVFRCHLIQSVRSQKLEPAEGQLASSHSSQNVFASFEAGLEIWAGMQEMGTAAQGGVEASHVLEGNGSASTETVKQIVKKQ